MSNQYADFNKKKIVEAKAQDNEFEDTITWEPACPEDIYNKYKSISNLQLNANNTIRGINYWLLESAHSWFIQNNQKFDPSTTLPIRTGLINRIILQKKLCELVPLEVDQVVPPTDKLIQNFNMYIQNKNVLSGRDIVMMKVFLHIGDTQGFLTDWLNESGEKITGNAIREKALEEITNSINGSWLLRETSIVSSDIIKAFAITCKNIIGEIDHIPIAHVYGFGYIVLNVFRDTVMPAEQSNEMFPKYTGTIYPSFIDLLEHLARVDKFNISNVIKKKI
jgi:hypothetical protein